MSCLKDWPHRLATLALTTLVALGGLAGLPAPASAARITALDCSADGLIRAISSANADRSQQHEFRMSPQCDYTLTTVADSRFGPTGLPVVTSDIRIIGFGSRILRSTAAGTPEFRLLAVADGGRLQLEDLTLFNGRAAPQLHGGAVYVANGTLVANRVMFYGSRAHRGGALAIDDINASVQSINSTFYTNQAVDVGGAVYLPIGAAAALLDSNTVYLNSAGTTGGGLFSNSRPLVLRNSIVVANFVGPSMTRGDADCGGGVYSGAASNLVGRGTGCPTGATDIAVDPTTVFDRVLGFAANNGGATLTVAPRPGSPAIDNGACNQPVDQRNSPRPQPKNGRCDIGAVEVTPVGVLDLSFDRATLRVNERLPLELTWTVPDGRNWHDLRSVDLRLRDERGVALWLRFDEASGTLMLVDPESGATGEGLKPGSNKRLRTDAAIVYLTDSELIGSGPSGQSVTLKLSIGFRRQAAERTLQVEVQAIDDQGVVQEFAPAGTIQVQER